METIVIVGANVAGGRAAQALRQEGFGGRIVLVGAEPERLYERPPLSKEYLSGERTEDQIYLRPPEYYAEQGIELRLGVRATGLDLPSRTLQLGDGQQLAYDKLLIATGASPRRPRACWAPGSRTRRSPSSGRTSMTSASSTSATQAEGTRSCSAVRWRMAPGPPSTCATAISKRHWA